MPLGERGAKEPAVETAAMNEAAALETPAAEEIPAADANAAES